MSLAVNRWWQNEMMQAMVNQYNIVATVMRLFQNDFDPLDTSEDGEFVVCDFSGYPGFSSVSTWTPDTRTEVPPRLKSEGPTLTFTSASGGVENSVYGYWIVDADLNVLWAERFPDGPYMIGSVPDQELVVTLYYAIRSEFHSEV